MKTEITISEVKGQSKFNKDEKIEWKGFYRYYGYFFTQYLNDKYPNVCTKPGFNFIFFTALQLNFEGKTVLADKKTDIQDIFINFVGSCKKRFIVVPVTFFMHQNILIYDTKLNELELFDSYGKTALAEFEKNAAFKDDSFKKMFDNYYCSIEKFFKTINNKIKFFKPVSFFPDERDFQNFEIKMCPKEKFKINSWGFCVVWSFWYVENRLRYPNKSRSELVKTLLDLFHKDIKTIKKSAREEGEKHEADMHLPICKIIRGYASFLTHLDKDLSYIQKLKLDYKVSKDVYHIQMKLYAFMIGFIGLYGYATMKLLK